MQNPGERSKSTRWVWVKGFFQNPFIIAAYYGGVIVVYFPIEAILNKGDPIALSAAGASVMVLFILTMLVSAIFFRVGREVEIESKIVDMQDFINAQHMGWIVNERYVRSVEFNSRETWVFTQDLSNDLSADGEIFQSVKANLNQGHKYVYYLPDVASSYDVVSQYAALHSYTKGQVRFYLIPGSNYSFYTEVVVYNVEDDERVAIEWLPQDDLNYYIAMDAKHTNYVTGIGRMYMKKFEEFDG